MGPAIDLYKMINEQFPKMNLIASGGVSALSDLENLRSAGCSGVIIGKAIYEGRISIAELRTFIKNSR